MDEEIEKIKKHLKSKISNELETFSKSQTKLKKEFEENIDVNPESDIPVTEKKVKYRRVKHINE